MKQTTSAQPAKRKRPSRSISASQQSWEYADRIAETLNLPRSRYVEQLIRQEAKRLGVV